MALAVAQHAEHRHLTVVHFAKAARPLPGHAHGPVTLLWEATLVDNQATGRLPTQKTVRVRRDLRHNRGVIPGRVADEMLKLPRAAIFNHGGHRFERAVFRRCEATQITPCHCRIVPGLGAEQLIAAVDESFESRGDLFDQRYGQPSSGHRVT